MTLRKRHSVLIIILGLNCLAFANTLVKLEQKALDLEKERLKLQSKISEITDHQKKLEQRISYEKPRLNKKIRHLQNIQNYPWGYFIANENPRNVDKHVRLLKKVTDRNLLDTQEYLFFQKEYSRQDAWLKAQIKSLDNQLQQIKQTEVEILKAEQEALKALSAQNETSLLSSKGFLGTPINAPISLSFGPRSIADSHAFVHNDGLTFKTRSGQSVYAIGLGKVIFSDALPDWQDTVIIEHHGGYYSVYTHLSNVRFKVGEEVSSSAVIGQTKGTTFYFELRHRKIALNPKVWLKGFK